MDRTLRSPSLGLHVSGVRAVDVGGNGLSSQTEPSSSPQAIMMSICLQSMVDELMVKKSGGSIRKVSGRG